MRSAKNRRKVVHKAMAQVDTARNDCTSRENGHVDGAVLLPYRIELCDDK